MNSMIDIINTIRYFNGRMTQDDVTPKMREDFQRIINNKLAELESQSKILSDVFKLININQ